MNIAEAINLYREKTWQWFENHAHRPHALAWLSLVAFTDAIFFPIPPEVFIVALMLAQPTHWRRFLSVSIISSAAGATATYFIATFLFNQFGAPILALYGLQHAFVMAQQLIHRHVFWAMAVVSFTPVPDKVFIYAAGFLGAPFAPFFAGYVLGRGIRMALFTYLTGVFGKHVIGIINRYFLYVAGVIFVLLALYGIVHFHLFGL